MAVRNYIALRYSYLVDSSSIMIEEPVTFTWSATGDNGDALRCSIDFDDDGNAGYQQTGCMTVSTVSHIYTTPGRYDAILTIENGDGGIASEVRTLAVRFAIRLPSAIGHCARQTMCG